jgi:hypothetical protein
MKKWITIPASALDSLDYSKLAVTNAETTPKNIAGDTALIKWYGDMPTEVASIDGKGETIDHGAALALLRSAEWQEEFQG